MTTKAQAIADDRGAPIVIVTLDGVGDAGGLWKFCSRLPSYSASAQYKAERFGEWPEILNEDVNPLGGVAAAGEFTIQLAEGNGDDLTALFRTEARAHTRLSGVVSAAALQVTLASGTGIVPGTTILYVDQEAMLVRSLVSGTTYDVTRAFLGTEAQAHEDDADVFLYLPNLYGRRMRLYVSHDLETYSVAEEEGASEIGGGWNVSDIGLTDDLNGWSITGRSQLKYIDRLLMRSAFVGFLNGASVNGDRLSLYGGDAGGGANTIAPHWQDRSFFKIGEEIIRSSTVGVFLGEIAPDVRGAAGTRQGDLRIGDAVRQVFVADPADGFGSFRYQLPGAETSSRMTGTWFVTAHPVPIMLALLMSSADPDHDVPDNWASGTGNYSALPGGVGLGVPVGRIDVDSFLDVWVRTQGYELPFFVLDERETGREVLDRICRLCGYDLKTRGGRLALDYYRMPVAGDATTTWGDAEVLLEEAEEGDRKPILRAKLDTSITAGAVVFRTRTSAGAEVESVFSDKSFPAVFGNTSGYYQSDDNRIEIDARYVRADVDGGEPEILRQRAMGLLLRHRTPLWRLWLSTDLSQDTVEPGTLVSITNAQLPDLGMGARGWTNEPCKVLTKNQVVNEDAVRIDWEAVRYECGRVGRICPSAMIVSTAAAGGGGYDVTAVANRYADPQARGGLPTADAAGFAVGQRVRLCDRGENPIVTTPAFQTVTALAGNVVTLDGDFGGAGAFAAGTVVRFVDRDAQTTEQAASYVSMADEATRTVGASGDAAWTFGEP